MKGAHLETHQRAATADDKQGRAVLIGVGDGGHAVGDAGAGGDNRDAAAPGGARPALGGVAGDLLVADIDNLDLFVQAGVVDRLHVAAAEGEDRVDALQLDGAGYEVASVNQSHGGLLS